MTTLYMPNKRPTEVIRMIVPGRRALGEDWSEVVIGHTDDAIVAHKRPTEAPEGGVPIMAVGGRDAQHMRDIVEAQRGKQAERTMVDRGSWECESLTCGHATSACPMFQLLNEMWWNYNEMKAKELAGITTIGAAGTFQRQRVNRSSNLGH